MKKVRPFMHTEAIKVITGIRRCGKSVMLELIRKELLAHGVPAERILFLNCESAADSRVKSAETILKTVKALPADHSDKRYIFMDEIQELPRWEKLVNSLSIDFNTDIYITGSNATLLSGELATYLAGRYVEIRMYPFSFAEVCALYERDNPSADRNRLFARYLVNGGFPFLHNYPLDDEGARQYLTDVFNSVILKDIVQRNGVRDVDLLRRLLMFFLANIGNSFSSGALVKYLKNERRSLSTETVYNYIEYCRSACLLHLATREDLMGKEILSTQEKIYCADHGIREAVYGNNLRDVNQVLENIVYMELLRRGYDVAVGRLRDAEVDFRAERGGARFYVQVAYLLAGEETIEREFGALEKVPDNFPKYVVTMDEIDRSRNGIVHRNIRDFLLAGDY